MKFEWDERKNEANIKKHGISFHDAIYVFGDPYALSIPDDKHSDLEERWILLGRNLQEKIILVVHTFRYNDIIRVISARKATRIEQEAYQKRSKQ